MAKVKKEPLGVRNRNPLNIRAGEDWRGKVGTNKGFVVFRNYVYAYRAAFRILHIYKYGHKIKTVGRIIQRWAPECENNTVGYIKRVCELTGFDPSTEIDVDNKFDATNAVSLVRAMASVETGVPYDKILHLTILAGFELSLLKPWDVVPDSINMALPFYTKDYEEQKSEPRI